MAAGNKIARRSTRLFSDDDPKPQVESASASDPGAGQKRGTSERGDNRLPERDMHSRNSSCSSTPTVDMGMELRVFHGATHETTREVSECLGFSKPARDRIDGRPTNFGIVMPRVYRSGYPEAADHQYLQKLGLKTIVTLVQKEFPEGYQTFIQLNGIQHVVIDMQGTKKVEISQSIMTAIMKVVLDQRNYPLLIHCNQGKHRTGCAVAVMRKVMGWKVDSIVEEYCNYADDKIRDNDIRYIRGFDIATLAALTTTPRFDNGGRAADGRAFSSGRDLVKMAKLTLVTALTLLLWLFTALWYRT